MLIKNTQDRFGLVAISLHWVIAILMIGLLALGLYMKTLPIGLDKLKLYGWHKEYGLMVLFLAFIRLGWRLINILPRLDIPWWEALAARCMHWAFYGFMFALPLTGWLMSSAVGLPVSFFGLFVMPDLIAPDEGLEHLLKEAHKWIAYGLIAAIILHASAALKHHFIDKDDILRRMIS